MRQFNLTNALGITYDLMDLESFFFDINGLGREKNTKYEQIGARYLPKENSIKQKKISGKLVFESYHKYEDFAKYIQHEPITMEYETDSTYWIDVNVDKLEKTELEEIGLVCNVIFSGLTQFYKKIEKRNSIVTGGKQYTYTYPYRYQESTSSAIVVESDSTIDIPVKITIIGKCENPSWSHYINGILVADGKIRCQIREGNRIVINSEQKPYYIKEFDSEGQEIKDHYQNSDFGTKRFLFLRRGRNVISFSHEGEGAIKIIVEGKMEYGTI